MEVAQLCVLICDGEMYVYSALIHMSKKAGVNLFTSVLTTTFHL